MTNKDIKKFSKDLNSGDLKLEINFFKLVLLTDQNYLQAKSNFTYKAKSLQCLQFKNIRLPLVVQSQDATFQQIWA